MQTMNCQFCTEAHSDHEQFEPSMPFNLWHTTSFCLLTIHTSKTFQMKPILCTLEK